MAEHQLHCLPRVSQKIYKGRPFSLHQFSSSIHFQLPQQQPIIQSTFPPKIHLAITFSSPSNFHNQNAIHQLPHLSHYGIQRSLPRYTSTSARTPSPSQFQAEPILQPQLVHFPPFLLLSFNRKDLLTVPSPVSTTPAVTSQLITLLPSLKNATTLTARPCRSSGLLDRCRICMSTPTLIAAAFRLTLVRMGSVRV
jgi:hypothetical protein